MFTKYIFNILDGGHDDVPFFIDEVKWTKSRPLTLTNSNGETATEPVDYPLPPYYICMLLGASWLISIVFLLYSFVCGSWIKTCCCLKKTNKKREPTKCYNCCCMCCRYPSCYWTTLGIALASLGLVLMMLYNLLRPTDRAVECNYDSDGNLDRCYFERQQSGTTTLFIAGLYVTSGILGFALLSLLCVSWTTCKQSFGLIILIVSTISISGSLKLEGAYPVPALIVSPILVIIFFRSFNEIREHFMSLIGIYASTFDFYTDILVIVYWWEEGNTSWALIQIFILLIAQLLALVHFRHVKKKIVTTGACLVILEKIFTVLGLGRQWFTILSWSKREYEEELQTMKVWEIMYESFPSLTLQLYLAMIQNKDDYSNAVTASIMAIFINASLSVWVYLLARSSKSDVYQRSKSNKNVLEMAKMHASLQSETIDDSRTSLGNTDAHIIKGERELKIFLDKMGYYEYYYDLLIQKHVNNLDELKNVLKHNGRDLNLYGIIMLPDHIMKMCNELNIGVKSLIVGNLTNNNNNNNNKTAKIADNDNNAVNVGSEGEEVGHRTNNNNTTINETGNNNQVTNTNATGLNTNSVNIGLQTMETKIDAKTELKLFLIDLEYDDIYFEKFNNIGVTSIKLLKTALKNNGEMLKKCDINIPVFHVVHMNNEIDKFIQNNNDNIEPITEQKNNTDNDDDTVNSHSIAAEATEIKQYTDNNDDSKSIVDAKQVIIPDSNNIVDKVDIGDIMGSNNNNNGNNVIFSSGKKPIFNNTTVAVIDRDYSQSDTDSERSINYNPAIIHKNKSNLEDHGGGLMKNYEYVFNHKRFFISIYIFMFTDFFIRIFPIIATVAFLKRNVFNNLSDKQSGYAAFTIFIMFFIIIGGFEYYECKRMRTFDSINNKDKQINYLKHSHLLKIFFIAIFSR